MDEGFSGGPRVRATGFRGARLLRSWRPRLLAAVLVSPLSGFLGGRLPLIPPTVAPPAAPVQPAALVTSATVVPLPLPAGLRARGVVSLAVADLDEDGWPDLIAGEALDAGWAVVVWPGRDPGPARPPAAGAAAGVAGLASPRVAIRLAEPPDILAAGDFDADSHLDLVATSLGSRRLVFLKGSGDGRLREASLVDLPGDVTALAVGDVNRADGLADLAVGIRAGAASRVLVYESAEGALREKPEVLELPREVATLLIARADDDPFADVVATGGGWRMVVHGRDRKRSLAPAHRQGVKPAAIDAIPLASYEPPQAPGGSGGTAADSAGRGRPAADPAVPGKPAADPAGERAAVAMRLTRDAVPVRVLGGSGAPSPEVDLPITRIFVVDSVRDEDDAQIGDGFCASYYGECTLRAAIEEANTIAGSDSIQFHIPTPALPTIVPGYPLPPILEGVTIDGTTQPPVNGQALVEIDGESAGAGVPGLLLVASGITLRGLVINRFGGAAIDIQSGSGDRIEANRIGTDVAGSVARPNQGPGIIVEANDDHVIGGTSPSQRNLISGNVGPGIRIDGGILGADGTGNLIEGNFIGLDASGLVALGNGDGVEIHFASGNTIGGATAGTGNVICCNGLYDVFIDSVPTCCPTVDIVQGNLIGTNVNGARLPNFTDYGIFMGNVQGGTIGGTVAAARNVIAGHGTSGVEIDASLQVLVQGNYIGTDSSGTIPIGNGTGLYVLDSSVNTIGGDVAGARNIISGNDVGLSITWSAAGLASQNHDNVVYGNYIGTDVNGTSSVGNFSLGVALRGVAKTTIGGNLISGNNGDGILISGPHAPEADQPNVLFGNRIGTDVTGMAILENYGNGVHVVNDERTYIGTFDNMDERNLISGNHLSGVRIESLTGDLNAIWNNFIGTNAAGTGALHNGQNGVYILNAPNNTVGGNLPLQGNLISGNVPNGVVIEGAQSTQNRISGNLIGTNVIGDAPLPNGGDGVLINGAASNTIGVYSTADRNIISGNLVHGVEITGTGADANIVDLNYIGTDSGGVHPLANGSAGVAVTGGFQNFVGYGGGNVLSANGVFGVWVTGANTQSTVVQSNLIGVDATGSTPLGNLVGVQVDSGATSSGIGGTTVALANVISGNGEGVVIQDAGTTGNTVFGNFIGTNASGAAFGNTARGIAFRNSASGNHVGGTSPGFGNVIAYNGGPGISVVSGNWNSILANSIFSNQALGIDLDAPGVTLNDGPGDLDTGANDLQNFPVLTSATCTNVQGTLPANPQDGFRVEFFASPTCDPSGHGEGAMSLGSTWVQTDATGTASFSLALPTPAPPSQMLTATATEDFYNDGHFKDTSEFSACVPVGTVPTEDLGLVWCAGSTICLQWNAVSGATSYNLYRGVPADQVHLFDASPDSCTRLSTSTLTTGSQLAEVPPVGSFYWYLVTARNDCGEGSAGRATPGFRIVNSTGKCH